MSFSNLYPIFSGAISGAVASGALSGPIKTLDDLWYIYIGHKTSERAEMIRIESELNTQKYKEQIISEVKKIPRDNIQQPRLSILGPALEASAHYIEEEELRNMFSKLVASSMDKSKESINHQCFVEIIKQMSPKEARILSDLSELDANEEKNFPIQQLLALNSVSKTQRYIIPMIAIFPSSPDYETNRTPVANLRRLGLIETSFNHGTIGFDSLFDNDMKLSLFKEKLKLKPDEQSNIVKGSLKLTALGVDFIKVCL